VLLGVLVSAGLWTTSVEMLLAVFLWSMNLAVPLVMTLQVCRTARLGRLCELHASRVGWSQAAPSYTEGSDEMFKTRDALVDFERQLAANRPHTREKRFFMLFTLSAVLCVGASCGWQLVVEDCELFSNAGAALAAASGLPSVVLVVQMWQCLSLRHQREAFSLQVEFRLLIAINAAYLLSQVIGGLLLTDDKSALTLLLQAHTTSTAMWLVMVTLVPLVCMWMALRKGKVRYIQNFDDFFAVPVSREFFSDYLDMELHSELISFWQDIESFKAVSDAHGGDGGNDGGAQSRIECMARNIHSKYIRGGSIMDVQLDAVLRQEVAFRVNTSIITKTIFDGAQGAVSEKLQAAYIRFLRHPMAARAMQTYLRKVLDRDY